MTKRIAVRMIVMTINENAIVAVKKIPVSPNVPVIVLCALPDHKDLPAREAQWVQGVLQERQVPSDLKFLSVKPVLLARRVLSAVFLTLQIFMH